MRSSVLALRLKAARTEAGLTQEALGVLAGIDEFSASARMNQYERGKHSPHYQFVARLASVLKVSVTYFYSDDDQEAELLLAFSKLTMQQKNATLEFVRNIGKGVPNSNPHAPDESVTGNGSDVKP